MAKGILMSKVGKRYLKVRGWQKVHWSKVGIRYLKVKGWQKIPKGPRLAKGTC